MKSMTHHPALGAARRAGSPHGRRLAALTLAVARAAGRASGTAHAVATSAGERLRRLRRLAGRRGRRATPHDADREETA
ncbi:hypothetical protein [Streptomyces sp. NPDC058855]|uniref:hypothetical protein n=1 Tax=Streptomyces sp. NPDC058855 TaxID=3346651 RepID=UPI0036C9DF49